MLDESPPDAPREVATTIGTLVQKIVRLGVLLPVALLIGATAATVGLIDAVLERDDLVTADPTVTRSVVAGRVPWVTAIAKVLTFSGGVLGLGALSALIVGWLVWRKRWLALGVFAGALTLSLFLTVALKVAVARDRPSPADVLGALAHDYAFPSGHTMNTTVIFGLLAGYIATQIASRWIRAALVLCWLLASGAVGASRVYLGYHWLTDVLGGFAIGVGVLSVAALVWDWLHQTGQFGTGVAARWPLPPLLTRNGVEKRVACQESLQHLGAAAPELIVAVLRVLQPDVSHRFGVAQRARSQDRQIRVHQLAPRCI